MPFVSIRTDLPIPPDKAETLQREIGRLISIIPGKNADNCMTQLCGGQQMYISGGPASAVFCEVRLFGAAPAESKAEFGAALDALLLQQLGPKKISINFMEFAEWFSGGEYKTI